MVRASGLIRWLKRYIQSGAGSLSRATAMSSLKDRLKSLSYNFGPLGLYHYLVNRPRLTVAMFHRVLPRGAPEWATADREYTLDTDMFDECLNFFARHYSVIGLDHLEAAAAARPCPVGHWLITFDDGWADTLIHAAPLLERRQLPAVCFAISDVLDDPAACWWQNAFDFAWRTKRTDLDALKTYWDRLGLAPLPKKPAIPNPYLLGLTMLADLPAPARTALAEQWLAGSEHTAPRQMLATSDLPALRNAGVAIGSHGMSHIPMTLSRDLADELKARGSISKKRWAGAARISALWIRCPFRTAVSMPRLSRRRARRVIA